ncbi:MAG: 16S rRNA (cytidine(1402)-2'-O)-methyltransferase [Candidatus Paceibacterota bacterium]|jgi:16S rRNA (cytidine1402-2'-O)-methyltransferase
MLYVVSTPVGNLKDISERALETLKNVDFIIAESPTDSIKLLNAYSIKKEIVKYNDKNNKLVVNKIVERLENENAAYITSAGTPGISDPGADLVKKTRETGVIINIIPGASALVSAVAVSGIRAKLFTFISFPPKKSGQMKNFFDEYKERKEVLVFFESTHRILKTLNILKETVPDCYVCVAKEMTKIFENYFTGSPQEVIDKISELPKNVRGEFTIVIDFK